MSVDATMDPSGAPGGHGGATAETPPPASAAPSTEGRVANGAFVGEGGRLAWLVFSTSLLTVLTLGIYRFWMKTKVRQYYWSSIRIDGEPLEYTGRALELLLGFLIAVLFLAVYLGAINLALVTFAIVQLEQIEPAIFLSFLAVFPFLPYAAYRAQRYLLSRTQWRGIRFGLDLAAWTYTGRYLLWTLLNIASLWLTGPIADFALRRFITDRTSFGDQKFKLVGRGGGLYRAYLPLWTAGAVAVALFGLAFAYGTTDFETGETIPNMGLFFGGVSAYVIAFFGFIWYSGFRLRYLLNRTEFGDGVRFRSTLSPGELMRIGIGGYFVTVLTIIATVTVMVVAMVLLAPVVLPMFGDLDTLFPDPSSGEEPTFAQMAPFFIVILLLYLVIGLVAATCAHVFVFRRTLRRIIQTTSIENLDRLDAAKQRPHAKEEGAEGFADALDVGAF